MPSTLQPDLSSAAAARQRRRATASRRASVSAQRPKGAEARGIAAVSTHSGDRRSGEPGSEATRPDSSSRSEHWPRLPARATSPAWASAPSPDGGSRGRATATVRSDAEEGRRSRRGARRRRRRATRRRAVRAVVSDRRPDGATHRRTASDSEPEHERRAKRARARALPRPRCAHTETGRAAAGATTRPAMRCGYARHWWTGMPSCRARSTRLSVMPEPGNAITPFGSRFSSSSLRRNGAARPCAVQSGLHTTWSTPLRSAQRAAIRSTPGPPPCARTMSAHLAFAWSRARDHRRRVLNVLAAGDGDERPSGRCARVSRSFRARMKSRASMLAEVSLPAARRSSRAAGARCRRSLRGTARPRRRASARRRRGGRRGCARVGDQLQLARLDLGAVLGGLEVAQLRAEPVDAAVEAADLGVEAVDEAPQQALALVGELEPVGRDAPGQDAERLGHRVGGVVRIPDVSAVELAALGGRAEQRRVLADGCGGGLRVALEGVDIEGHDDLPCRSHVRGRSPL